VDQQATIATLNSAIAISPPIGEPLTAWRLADSPLLHEHARRLVGCEITELGLLGLTYDQESGN
jgi:hypothetical protein